MVKKTDSRRTEIVAEANMSETIWYLMTIEAGKGITQGFLIIPSKNIMYLLLDLMS